VRSGSVVSDAVPLTSGVMTMLFGGGDNASDAEYYECQAGGDALELTYEMTDDMGRIPLYRPSGPGPCPQCGAPTRQRNGRKGPFFGCAEFPRCRGTRNA